MYHYACLKLSEYVYTFKMKINQLFSIDVGFLPCHSYIFKVISATKEQCEVNFTTDWKMTKGISFQ